MKKIALAILLALLILATPTQAESLDFSIIITAEDASLRVNTNAKCFTDSARTLYEQHVRTVRSETLDYESVGMLDNTNNMSVSTNFTATHNPVCAISSVFYVENIAIGNNPLDKNCSSGASGIYADSGVSDIDLASIAATTQTSLTHGYVMQTHSTTKGTAKAGYRKHTKNLTVESIYGVHAKDSAIAGLVTHQIYPAGPVRNGKPSYCVWQGEGVGYPIFNGHSNSGNGNGNGNGNDSDNSTTKTPYYIMARK